MGLFDDKPAAREVDVTPSLTFEGNAFDRRALLKGYDGADVPDAKERGVSVHHFLRKGVHCVEVISLQGFF